MRDSKVLLEKYVEAVMSAPESLHLTATRDPKEFWQRHVMDALKLIELLPQKDHERKLQVLDVGSGNGIPGIPAAIAVPLWQVTLLDSDNKKCGFLDMFCKNNAIQNVQILPKRAELAAHSSLYREVYHVVYARALGKLPVSLELSSPFLKIGGTLIVPHGTSWPKEIKASEKAMKELGLINQGQRDYALGEGPIFTALLFEKIFPTPEKYPRNVGIPAKRPL